MFEQALLDFIKKSEYYPKYKKLYDYWRANPDKYRCAVSTPEMMLETLLRNTLESTIEADNIVHQREGFILDRELRELNLLT